MKRDMGTYLRAIEPITRNEFAHMFQRTKPPVGWGRTIAVANSGGPDSTCLLFLLHRHFFEMTHSSHAAHKCEVVSLAIDHSLQASSSEMAKKTESFAKSLGVQHSTRKIPWGQGVFPPRPSHGTAFEGTARRARYKILFDEMTRLRADTLALGHHLDDQIETSLMRLGMGSSMLGMSGMKYCRRWGMGNHIGGLDWAGYDGMNKWLIRPFLGVGKDRILATCEANQLEYVVDKTNFQSDVTLRNAIRHVVLHGKKGLGSLPPALLEDVQQIDKALESLPQFLGNLDSGPERLRELAQGLANEVDQIERRVDDIIETDRLPSPEGTFMISQKSIVDLKGQPMLQRALVLRILRYISPKPWGSRQSQGRRRSTPLAELARRLMQPIYRPSQVMTSAFTMGSEVAWKPVFYRDNSFRMVTASYCPRSEDVLSWLACRQPPDSQNRFHVYDKDLTVLFLESLAARKSGTCRETLDILYDCRFLVQFNLDAVPDNLPKTLCSANAQLVLTCERPWFYPSIVIQTPGQCLLLHNQIDGDTGITNFPVQNRKQIAKSAPWVNVRFIRALSQM